MMLARHTLLLLLLPLCGAACSDDTSGALGDDSRVRITSTPPERARIHREYVYEICVDGRPYPSLRAENLPAWLRLDGSRLVGTPDVPDIGPTAEITIIADNGTTDEQTFVIEVASEIWYVDSSAAPGGNGGSWETAFRHPSEAMDGAWPGEEVWIRAGTYGPGPNGSVLEMADNVNVYGSFAGTEQSRDERTTAPYTTVLNAAGTGPVVRPASNAVLNGLVLTGGSDTVGGGMRVGPEISNLLVTDCFFVNNAATEGGGTAVVGGDVQFSNCLWSSNRAPFGAGLLLADVGLNTWITNGVFTANNADRGGAISIRSARPWMRHCSIVGNNASSGGALYVESGAPELINSIVWSNTPGDLAIVVEASAELVVAYSNIQGGWPGAGNIAAEPLFIGPSGYDGQFGTADDNLRLRPESPGIDAALLSSAPKFDFEGKPRPQQDGADMGAYEGAVDVLYVRPGADDGGDGSSWDQAFAHPRDALLEASPGAEVRIAAGVYTLPPDAVGPVLPLPPGVAVYGGWAGPATSAPAAASPSVTVLDGLGQRRVVEARQAHAASLSGCVITGGMADVGAGLLAYDSNDLLIADCTFVNNAASENGGAIRMRGGWGTIKRCRVLGNFAGGDGGGLAFYSLQHPVSISNCVLAGNRALHGGGMVAANASLVLRHCAVVHNTADEGAGAMMLQAADAAIANSIVYHNTARWVSTIVLEYDATAAVRYSDVESGFHGEANIDQPPGFVDADGADNLAGTRDDDHHLKADSPVIDRGDAAEATPYDLDSVSRPQGEGVDMGPYEYHP